MPPFTKKNGIQCSSDQLLFPVWVNDCVAEFPGKITCQRDFASTTAKPTHKPLLPDSKKKASLQNSKLAPEQTSDHPFT